MSLIQELKRRNVFRVGLAYTVTAWLVIQVVETLFPVFELGNESIRMVVIVLAIGLFPVLFFAWAFELTPEGLKREKDVDRTRSITPQTGKKLDRWVIILLALALAYFLFDKFILSPAREAELLESATQIAEQAILDRTPDKSIAVLPFVNMSSDPEQEFFSDGVSEEILNALAQVKELKVAGRTSSFAFKGRNEDLRNIGELLNVAHVLEGSIRKSGNRVRITAQLIKVDDGYHLWSETFDRELTDVFAIQDEIALAILDQLKAQLLGEASPPVMALPTNIEVYQLYLQARQLIYERQQKSLELAARLLDRALVLDPEYAPAYAQLGIALLLLSERSYGDVPYEQARARARRHLDKAVELDANLAEAWAGLGLYEEFSVESVQFLEKALAINPNLLDALNWMQISKGLLGDERGSNAITQRMLEIDPLYIPAFSNANHDYIWAGQAEESWALLEKIRPYLSDNPKFMAEMAYTHFFLGQYALGLTWAESAVKSEPRDRISRETLCFAWNSTHQFERTIELCGGHSASIAHWQLGRAEEALLLAHEPAVEGRYFQPYFQILNANDSSHKLIEFVESRWPDLEDFGADFSFTGDIRGYAPLNEIALAYIRAGEHDKARVALNRVRNGQEQFDAQGRDTFRFSLNKAVYHTLTGDHETALEHLAKAIDGGYIGATRITHLVPALEPLEGDPRYEAIQSRMINHLNDERAALGLDPVAR